jgi:hypothetical protein
MTTYFADQEVLLSAGNRPTVAVASVSEGDRMTRKEIIDDLDAFRAFSTT